MLPFARSINMAVPSASPQIDLQPTGLAIFALNAALVGSTSDTVGRFNATEVNRGTRPLAEWVTITHDAALASTFEIILRGIYAVMGFFDTAGVGTVEMGCAMDGPTTVDLNAGTLGCLGHARRTLAAGDNLAVTVSGIAVVTQAIADTPGAGVIRMNISNASGGSPVGGPIQANQTGLRIWRIGDTD